MPRKVVFQRNGHRLLSMTEKERVKNGAPDAEAKGTRK